jgi:hypothetical protein
MGGSAAPSMGVLFEVIGIRPKEQHEISTVFFSRKKK